VDVTSGATHYWQLPGHFPGEPIFVGRPGARREDDGVLLVVVLAAPERRSYLLVLDAGSMEEVARAEVPHDIKFGFHGNLVAPDGTSTELS
jgi:carotenoid cleavage dioxygenase-like enzyme